ncbi:DNA methyltransferase [Bradyrhizobium guangdongense]
MQKLLFGDNLYWLEKMEAESVDLVYLDPPFNSQANYNILYKSPTGEESQAQYQTFVDSWRWGPATDLAFAQIMNSRSPAAGIVSSLNNFMQKSDLSAYLVMMAVRLVQLHRVLKATGSLYLHCDSSASHYLKVILDAIFGPAAFRNEIIWKRSHAHNDSKQGARHFGRVTDTLLFYAKSRHSTWNTQYTKYDENYTSGMYKHVEEDTGRRYGLFDLSGPGGAAKGNPQFDFMGVKRYWRFTHQKMLELRDEGKIVQTRPGAVPRQKRYLDEMPGVQLQNLWDDLPLLSNRSKEALGYQTQKPLILLERIIKASTNPGDTVLDPFCGCGTAIEAAHLLKRNWIGIDITALAIDVVERRLSRLGLRRERDYHVDGAPVDVDGARKLWEKDEHQFQLWAITLVDGQPRDGGKRGADRGVDGLIYFQDDARTVSTAIISVKGGKNIHARDIRELSGAMHARGSKVGIFITLHKPTGEMERVARESGSVECGGKLRSRIQIRTIEELFSGKKIDLPPVHDIISATASSRRVARSRPSLPPTPHDIREAPSFKLPISGGKNARAQTVLFLEEPSPIMTQSKRSKKRKSA